MKILLKYVTNVLYAIDQLVNAILGGDPDESISGRLGKLKRRHGGIIPWYRPLSGLADHLLEKIDPGHTIDAIEDDEGKNSILH